MDAAVWGPPLWSLLHVSAHAVDARQSRERQALASHYSEMLDCLEHLLPCKYCRQSLRAFRDALRSCAIKSCADYAWMLHNMVGEKLWRQKHGKKPFQLFSRVAADDKWSPSAAIRVGSPASVLGALQAIAFNFPNTGAKADEFQQLWRHVAVLCNVVPELRSVSRAMRLHTLSHMGTAREMHAAATAALRQVTGCGESNAHSWSRTARARVKMR